MKFLKSVLESFGYVPATELAAAKKEAQQSRTFAMDVIKLLNHPKPVRVVSEDAQRIDHEDVGTMVITGSNVCLEGVRYDYILVAPWVTGMYCTGQVHNTTLEENYDVHTN
ncbi:hypothetical protein MYOV003v1_p0026 [Vibrio phage 207E48.1]|nr:hypothetical protein MYOV003v1_p0026 [Vibrio phage 207E48.1]